MVMSTSCSLPAAMGVRPLSRARGTTGAAPLARVPPMRGTQYTGGRNTGQGTSILSCVSDLHILVTIGFANSGRQLMNGRAESLIGPCIDVSSIMVRLDASYNILTSVLLIESLSEFFCGQIVSRWFYHLQCGTFWWSNFIPIDRSVSCQIRAIGGRRNNLGRQGRQLVFSIRMEKCAWRVTRRNRVFL